MKENIKMVISMVKEKSLIIRKISYMKASGTEILITDTGKCGGTQTMKLLKNKTIVTPKPTLGSGSTTSTREMDRTIGLTKNKPSKVFSKNETLKVFF